MSHSFDSVDEKIIETEFFLKKMAEVKIDILEFRHYFSAFLSASRTSTLALQQFNEMDGFQEWYEPHRDHLKASGLAKFFLDKRNEHIHGHPSPISGGSFHQGTAKFFFERSNRIPDWQRSDVVTICRNYFILLLEIIYDCYVKLGRHIDPQQYYSKENFATTGRTIENAEAEVWGWICSDLVAEGFDEDGRWHELRSHVGGCQINHLFYSYLGKTTPEPEISEHFREIEEEWTPADKGWVHIPAGFNSMEDYFRSLEAQKPPESETS